MTTTICFMMNKEIPRTSGSLGQSLRTSAFFPEVSEKSISRDAGISRRRVVLEAPGKLNTRASVSIGNDLATPKISEIFP